MTNAETKQMNQTMLNFIYSETLINPLKEIIKNLEKTTLRNYEIEYLVTKLKEFSQIALEAVGKKLILPRFKCTVWNEYNRDTFLRYFKTLLSFFESVE